MKHLFSLQLDIMNMIQLLTQESPEGTLTTTFIIVTFSDIILYTHSYDDHQHVLASGLIFILLFFLNNMNQRESSNSKLIIQLQLLALQQFRRQSCFIACKSQSSTIVFPFFFQLKLQEIYLLSLIPCSELHVNWWSHINITS